MKIQDTFQATIFIGFKERDTGLIHTIIEIESICQEYCNEVGLCVTVTPTEYIYTNNKESGCFIGLINYPRFPSTQNEITLKAITLAEKLMIALNQFRVTVVTSNKTYMLENNIT